MRFVPRPLYQISSAIVDDRCATRAASNSALGFMPLAAWGPLRNQCHHRPPDRLRQQEPSGDDSQEGGVGGLVRVVLSQGIANCCYLPQNAGTFRVLSGLVASHSHGITEPI